MTTFATDTPSAMIQLKERTTDLHQAAERSSFQVRLVRGEVTRAQYGAWLGQMLVLHVELERLLRAARSASPEVAAVVHDFQFRELRLIDDLKLLGVDPSSVKPLASTSELVQRVRDAAIQGPLALLGMHYVLEGSNNGSKFIARSVRRSLSLTPGAGDQYLDPYGDAQQQKWAQFKADMTKIPFTQAQIDTMVESARAMFDGIRLVSDELAEQVARG